MSQNSVYIANNKFHQEEKKIESSLVTLENEDFLKISDCDGMRPFFMSVVSDSNHWMFISSNGGLTAGRKDSNYSLFPYYTDDKITESADITGSKTIFQVRLSGKTYVWEPFSERYAGMYRINRNLYKNTLGNKIIFEEINNDLGLTFSYEWNSSNEYGFVKRSKLVNTGDQKIEVTVLDGIQNLVPYGVPEATQTKTSNLVDAYKRNELMEDVGIGIFALSAVIVDKAEPSEALKATVAWSSGLDKVTYLLSSLQLDAFRKGKKIEQELDVKAEKGAYFISSDISIDASQQKSWFTVANVNQSIVDIERVAKELRDNPDIEAVIRKSVEDGSQRLLELNAASDGLQLSSDRLKNARHFSNTLFNIMRGGIFDDGYKIERGDFLKYISVANKPLFDQVRGSIQVLPETFSHSQLIEFIKNQDNSDLQRLGYEYMPLKFSRRHGDPSRPWNRFSINTTSEIDGSKILDYEGNWRDIFQNWEALAHSYPGYIDSMIHKFVNASTFDGYNPYRITRDGIDWEVIEEDDPWSYIGYWGDHQIIYLLKFLEFIEDHYPGQLADYFKKEIFVYANVPYKIRTYEQILQNPKDTIDFDYELQEVIEEERSKLGSDGALLKSASGSICKVNLLEKLMASFLAKISNFLPEAGIWMNTQRPEWNDANNALVGNGVSMVTLCYLRRFMHFLQNVLEKTELDNIPISSELADCFSSIADALNANRHLLDGKISDSDRKNILDALGIAGSTYREQIYNDGISDKKSSITKSQLQDFCKLSIDYFDHTIAANRREDELYHAYNIMTIENDEEVSVSYLDEMLEGQVAVLSSGFLSASAAADVLDALRNSALYRPDQNSYLLYPNKELLNFVSRNNIPAELVQSSELFKKLLDDGNTQVIVQDIKGKYHFNGTFNNANSLKKAMSELPETYSSLVKKDHELALDIFEAVFDHKSFTGRSGTFYGYEGLGSIYWHMVSKLLLSVSENCLWALQNGEDESVTTRLIDHFHEINEGIGVHKSPEVYGAFSTDPYSHTPATKGAQQPGMTGQVKEDLISRLGELGVMVEDGKISFKPRILKKEEFLASAATFSYPDLDGNMKSIELEKDTLCFTYCQVPVIYRLSDKASLKVIFGDNSEKIIADPYLDPDLSAMIFERTGEIERLEIGLERNVFQA